MIVQGLDFFLLVKHVFFLSHESGFVLRDELLLLFEVLIELAFFEDALEQVFCLDVHLGVFLCSFEDGREVCVAEGWENGLDV